MGDFAAGKVLTDGVLLAPVTVEDFAQFVNDLEAEGSPFLDSVTQAPAGGDWEKMRDCTVPGTPAELLVCLKQWRDTEVNLWLDSSSFCLLPADAVSGGGDQPLLIGQDANGDGLFMDPASGLLSTPDKSLGVDLAGALGELRDKVVAKQIEWCEVEWIEKM